MDQSCYYVYAPRYVATSAGIRGLYELVRLLRSVGEAAWIVTQLGQTQDQLPDSLADLILDYELCLAHRAEGREVIVVYSETVAGNPLNAQAIVRYVMNVPGLLGGPKTYAKDECVYAFSETLAEAIGKPDWSLFIPLVDETHFVPAPGVVRNISCVYASKYRQVHKSVPKEAPAGAIEISRDLEGSPNRSELLGLLQRARRLYLYENSAIAIEAALCGCLVIFVENPYLQFSIGAKDHGNAGMAWGTDPREITRAEKSLPEFRADYIKCRAALLSRLGLFVDRTKAYRRTKPHFGMDPSVLKPPSYEQLAGEATHRYVASAGLLKLVPKALDVFKRRGPLTTARIVFSLLIHQPPRA